jgi:hypothetical protein
MSELLGFTPLVAFGLFLAAVGFYAIRRERIELRKTAGKRG